MVSNKSRLSIPKGRRYDWTISAVGTILILAAWQLVTGTMGLVNPLVFPSPLLIVENFLEFRPLIQQNLVPTLQTAVFGFVAACTLGMACAILFAASDQVDHSLMPFMLGFNTVPRVALAPLLIFYLGPFQAKYLISAWIAFFPVFLVFKRALETVDEDLAMLSQSVDMTFAQEMRYVRLPGALPAIFDAMKYGIILAFTGAIVAELVASETGLGYLVIFALGSFQTPLVFAIVATIGIVVTVLFLLLFSIQYKVVFWKDATLFE